MSVKRKAEGQSDTQEMRKARRLARLEGFKGELVPETGYHKSKTPTKRKDAQAKEDTGGGVWSALFPDEDQSEHNQSQPIVGEEVTETSQSPG